VNSVSELSDNVMYAMKFIRRPNQCPSMRE